MACNYVSSFFLIALLLFAAANPLAHGQIGSPQLLGLRVGGQLCCTPNGNCPGTGVPGAVVSLNCTTLLGTSVVIGQNTTGVNGSFNINVRNILGLILSILSPPLSPLPCVATVQLPLNQTLCPVLSTVNGTLVGAVQTVGTIVTGLGRILNVTVPTLVFVNVTVGVGI